MTLIRTVEPAAEPVTLAGMKAHLRVTHSSEDELISGLIKAAREEVERSTSLALIRQSWRLVLGEWPRDGCISLQPNPVIGVSSVAVFDENGDETILPAGSYLLDNISNPARLQLKDMAAPGKALNGIEVEFEAGYGDSGVEVPEGLKRAIGILVAYWYEFRGAYGAKDQPVAIPGEYLRIIRHFRAPRLR
ncbi:hypothetical protein GCM10023174_01510 [Chelativorans composti]|jgi:phage conserved hypothetical protein, phiE125 gp8 family|uniref:Head-tail connector protein n=1 Tax=Chelativorans composti TaxID=768533 RepID=A0ABW5DFP3_9HYPH